MAYGQHIREEMKSKEAQLRNFFGNIDVAIRRGGGGFAAPGPQKWDEEEQTLATALKTTAATVHARLLDSIDTRGAMDALSDLIKAVNVYLAAREDPQGPEPRAFLLRQAATYVTKILSVFGITPGAGDAVGMPATAEGSASAGATTGVGAEAKTTAAVLDAFCGFRDVVRGLARNGAPPRDVLSACDDVRDHAMVDLGIRLEDKADGGSVWKGEDPGVLKAERDEKAAAVAAAMKKKLKTKLEAARKELDKYEKLSVLPSVQEALKEKYSKFNESGGGGGGGGGGGEPTHDAEGNALEGKALDKAKKEFEKQKKIRAPLEKRVAEEGAGFLDGLRRDIDALQVQLEQMQVNVNGSSSSCM